jgi:hypothetical protein
MPWSFYCWDGGGWEEARTFFVFIKKNHSTQKCKWLHKNINALHYSNCFPLTPASRVARWVCEKIGPTHFLSKLIKKFYRRKEWNKNLCYVCKKQRVKRKIAQSGHPACRWYELLLPRQRRSGLPDFSWYVIPKPEKCTKWTQNVPNGHKFSQM